VATIIVLLMRRGEPFVSAAVNRLNNRAVRHTNIYFHCNIIITENNRAVVD